MYALLASFKVRRTLPQAPCNRCRRRALPGSAGSDGARDATVGTHAGDAGSQAKTRRDLMSSQLAGYFAIPAFAGLPSTALASPSASPDEAARISRLQSDP